MRFRQRAMTKEEADKYQKWVEQQEEKYLQYANRFDEKGNVKCEYCEKWVNENNTKCPNCNADLY